MYKVTSCRGIAELNELLDYINLNDWEFVTMTECSTTEPSYYTVVYKVV